jgi:hypothetical protein
VDEVPGVYRPGQVVHGTFNPAVPLDFSDIVKLSNSMADRFGDGAGQPIVHDLTALPAIVVNPDRRHALKGGGVNERVWSPQEKSIQELKIDPAEWGRGQNLVDYQFLRDLQERVVRPLDLGLPVGTDPALWDWEASGHAGLPGAEPGNPAPPATSPPSPPVVAPPVHQPAGPGLRQLSPAGQRADELRSLVRQIEFGDTLEPLNLVDTGLGWAVLKPFAVEVLRFWRELRNAVRRLAGMEPREIPAEDR